jgi:hypothetical protein
MSTCILPSLLWSFDGVSIGKFIPVAVWDTTRHQLCNFSGSLLPFILCVNLKSVTPCNPSFGEEVLGTCKKGWVTLRVTVNVQFELTTTPSMPRQSDKTKKFTHCRCVLKQKFWSFLHVGSLFYDAFSVTRLYSVNDRVISKWWWTGKDLVESGHGLSWRYYPGIVRSKWTVFSVMYFFICFFI